MKRFFDKLYIKEASTPFSTITLTELNGTGWKCFNLRAKAKRDDDKDGEADNGDGTKETLGEKTDFDAPMSMNKTDYDLLRGFINKKVTLVLVDTDNPDANGDYQECPACFGIRVYPKKSIVSGEDCTISLTGSRSTSAGNLNGISRDVTVTN